MKKSKRAKNMKRPHIFLSLVMIALAIVLQAPRAEAVPQGIVIQGRLLNGSTPVESASVVVTAKVTSTGASECVLFEEEQTLNLTSSSGLLAITLGTGTRTANDKGLSLAQVFSNKTQAITSLSCSAGGTSYTPSSTDARNVYLTFNDNGTVIAMGTPYLVQAVPFAMEADRLSGLTSTEFIQVTSDTTQAKLNALMTTTAYQTLTDLIAGSSSLYAPASGSFTSSFDFNSQRVTHVATPTTSTDATNKNYVDTTLGTKTLDQTTISALNNGTDIGKVLSWTGTQWTASSPASDSTKLPLTGGTLSGNLDLGSHNLTSVGSATLSTTVFSDSQGTPKTATLRAPASIANSYVLRLPTDLPSVSGYVLSSDTSGNTSWVAQSGGGGGSSQWTTLSSDIYYATGKVGIGTTSAPSYTLDVTGDGRFTNGLTTTTLTYTSDQRLKKNIEPLEGSLEKILKLNGVTFNWRDPAQDRAKQIGFVAQEVRDVYPELVKKRKDGFLSVNYVSLVSPLVEAVKELVGHLTRHDDEIATLRAENEALAKRLEALESKLGNSGASEGH